MDHPGAAVTGSRVKDATLLAPTRDGDRSTGPGPPDARATPLPEPSRRGPDRRGNRA